MNYFRNKNHPLRNIIAAAAMCVVFASPAFTSPAWADDHGIYIYAQAGIYRPTNLQNSTSISAGTAYGAGLGYQFNSHIAAELRYANFSTSGIFSTEVNSDSYSVAGIGLWPVSEKISFLGRLGVASTATSLVPPNNNSTTKYPYSSGLTCGFGLQQNITESFRMYWRWDRTIVRILPGKFNAYTYSFGLGYLF
ncbi:MAG: porin family protein [Gallionella sp.]